MIGANRSLPARTIASSMRAIRSFERIRLRSIGSTFVNELHKMFGNRRWSKAPLPGNFLQSPSLLPQHPCDLDRAFPRRFLRDRPYCHRSIMLTQGPCLRMPFQISPDHFKRLIPVSRYLIFPAAFDGKQFRGCLRQSLADGPERSIMEDDEGGKVGCLSEFETHLLQGSKQVFMAGQVRILRRFLSTTFSFPSMILSFLVKVLNV